MTSRLRLPWKADIPWKDVLQRISATKGVLQIDLQEGKA
jgi:hypothetical protein